MVDTEAEFTAALLARTRELRIKRGFNKRQMAEALGVPYDNYRQYEKRTPLPHYLIPRFAAIVDQDVGVVLTGRRPPRAQPSQKAPHAPAEPNPDARPADTGLDQ